MAGPCSTMTPPSMNSTRSATSRAKAHLVGDDDHGHAVVGELAHHAENVADQFRIERRGGLVEQDGLGLHRQRARNRDALLLAAGELRRMCVGLLGEPHLHQQGTAALECLRTRLLLHIERTFDDVLQHRPVRKQIEALEHHRDLGADFHDRRRVAVDLQSLDADLAAVVAFEPVDTAQDGGLAGAGRTDDADHLALLHRRRDALEHLVLAKTLVDVGKLDHFLPARFSK
ncbi:hypothetical protein ACVW04_006749 [Bradyrhizobium sp. LM2.3]